MDEDTNCYLIYDKYDETEVIEPYDLISLVPGTNTVTKSIVSSYKQPELLVIGVCKKIINNQIYVANTGIIDVNVTGIICLGDKLTASNIAGKAEAIKYVIQDERVFNIRSIGKVIGIYDVYNRAQVLLDIE